MEWTPELPTTFLTVKKALFYRFFPSKAIEDFYNKVGIPYDTRKDLIEIRDVYEPTSTTELGLTKVLSAAELRAGAISIPHDVAFDHVFRHWSMNDTRMVLSGNRRGTVQTIWDVTDEARNFVKYHSDWTRFYRRSDGHYELGFSELIAKRSLRPLDRFALTYDATSSAFVFMWYGPFM